MHRSIMKRACQVGLRNRLVAHTAISTKMSRLVVMRSLSRSARSHAAESSDAGKEASMSGQDLAAYAFFGSLVALTFGLGCWQTKRLFWKLQLIEERKRQVHKEISTVDEVIAALTTTDEDLENG